MAKISASQFLKPGAKLEAKKIDFNDPAIKAFLEKTIEKQKEILRYKTPSKKTLESVIQLF